MDGCEDPLGAGAVKMSRRWRGRLQSKDICTIKRLLIAYNSIWKFEFVCGATWNSSWMFSIAFVFAIVRQDATAIGIRFHSYSQWKKLRIDGQRKKEQRCRVYLERDYIVDATWTRLPLLSPHVTSLSKAYVSAAACQMSILFVRVSPNPHLPCLQLHIPTLATYPRPSLVDIYPEWHTQAQMMIVLRFIRGPFALSEANGSTRLACSTTCNLASLPFNVQRPSSRHPDWRKAKHRFNLVTRRLAIVRLLRTKSLCPPVV